MWEEEDNFLGPFKADEEVVYWFKETLILILFYLFIDFFCKLKNIYLFPLLLPIPIIL